MFVWTLLMGCPGEERVGDSANGATLYAANCASCHGDDGALGLVDATDLTVSMGEKSDAELADVIVNGEGSMPAFSALSEQDVADLIAYMHEAFE